MLRAEKHQVRNMQKYCVYGPAGLAVEHGYDHWTHVNRPLVCTADAESAICILYICPQMCKMENFHILHIQGPWQKRNDAI